MAFPKAQLDETRAPRQARKILRDVEARENLTILGVARRDDSADDERNVAFAGAQINLTPGREAELARRSLAYQAMRLSSREVTHEPSTFHQEFIFATWSNHVPARMTGCVPAFAAT